MTDSQNNTELTAPNAAIGGTGRSGTGYIAALLKAVGVKSGHEKWWAERENKRTSGLDVDSSWIAAGDRSYEGLFYHQTRHPLAVLSSLLHDNPFRHRRSAHYKIRAATLQAYGWGESGDATVDALRSYVLTFNLAERKAIAWWRIEDVNADLVMRLSADLGYLVSRADADDALARVHEQWGTTYHYHGDKQILTLDDLPDPARRPVVNKVVEIMERYGYTDNGSFVWSPAGAYTEPYPDTPATLDEDEDATSGVSFPPGDQLSE